MLNNGQPFVTTITCNKLENKKYTQWSGGFRKEDYQGGCWNLAPIAAFHKIKGKKGTSCGKMSSLQTDLRENIEISQGLELAGWNINFLIPIKDSI